MTASRETGSLLDEDRLRRLIAAGRSLVAERELERVLDRLLEVARELTGAEYAAIEPLWLTDGGGHARSYGFPAGDPESRTSLGVPILIRGEAWGNLYLTDREDNELFDDADEEATVVLAAWAAIAVENARLYRETDQRRVALERSIRALEATLEIARTVGAETRLDRVLELIANRSRALVEASGVVILLSEGNEFVIAATAGDVPPSLTGMRVAASRSMAERVLAAGEPERVRDVLGSEPFALAELGVRPSSGLFVPLLFRGAHIGVIEAFDRVDGPEFRDEDEGILLATAASAATAVATAQSVERDRLRRSLRAAEEERRRWARELHDETLQGLAGLRVLLSSARRRDDVATLHEALDTAVGQLTDEIVNLRSLITELRPAALDELGLRPALQTLVERARITHGVEIDARVELGGCSRLDPDIETAIYRVLQESLSNAIRHGRPERIEIDVIESGEEIQLGICDDGRGFDVEAASIGFGLTGMRERISLAGGRLEITSSPSGTTISARLPSAR